MFARKPRVARPPRAGAAPPAAAHDGAASGPKPRPPSEATRRSTYTLALDLLTVRSRSAKQLERKLLEKGEPEDQVTAAIARLIEARLLDDAGYAASRARAGVAKARSRRRMVEKLAQEGVARDVAKTAVDGALEEEGGEIAAAMRAAEKKLRTLDRAEPAAKREKLYGFLARQGYEPSTVRAVLRAALDASVIDASVIDASVIDASVIDEPSPDE